jgi:predicted nucleic acid-binding protein
MKTAEAWFTCRVAFVETFRALAIAAGSTPARRFAAEWPAFNVVEVEQELVASAAHLSVARGLRSLDALHLASALLLPVENLALATWDRRLHSAAGQERVALVPESLA